MKTKFSPFLIKIFSFHLISSITGKKKISIIGLLILFLMLNSCNNKLPEGFVYLHNVDPSIQLDLKYITSDNFVGTPVNGYKQQVCICTEEAAKALKEVQKEVQAKGWSLIVFDAYRPQKAVNHFIQWAKDLNDTLTKSKFYPQVDKKDLFKLNYIASKSSHSRGSTFDLSILDEKGELQEMGTPFDYFGPESWPDYDGITSEQRAKRLYLQSIMKKHGFKPYPEEWWHFTLKEEPFPDTYYNFDVK